MYQNGYPRSARRRVCVQAPLGRRMATASQATSLPDFDALPAWPWTHASFLGATSRGAAKVVKWGKESECPPRRVDSHACWSPELFCCRRARSAGVWIVQRARLTRTRARRASRPRCPRSGPPHRPNRCRAGTSLFISVVLLPPDRLSRGRGREHAAGRLWGLHVGRRHDWGSAPDGSIPRGRRARRGPSRLDGRRVHPSQGRFPRVRSALAIALLVGLAALAPVVAAAGWPMASGDAAHRSSALAAAALTAPRAGPSASWPRRGTTA